MQAAALNLQLIIALLILALFKIIFLVPGIVMATQLTLIILRWLQDLLLTIIFLKRVLAEPVSTLLFKIMFSFLLMRLVRPGCKIAKFRITCFTIVPQIPYLAERVAPQTQNTIILLLNQPIIRLI